MSNINEHGRDQTEYLLTTVDNPYDPFTQWDEWFIWDQRAGYNTPGFLDRVARTSGELSEADQHLVIQQAIDEIVYENVLGVYRKVKAGDIKLGESANANTEEDE